MFIVLGTRKHKCIVADLCDALVHLLVINLTYLHVVVDISVHCLDYCIWIVSCSLSRLVAMCSVAHQIGRLHGQVCGCLRKVSCAIGSVCDFRSTIYLESSQLSATEPVHMRPFEAT